MNKYDEAMARLEVITKQLATNISFESSLELFKEGVELVKTCRDELVERQGVITELTKDLNGLNDDE